MFAPRGLAERLDALHGQPGFTVEALDVVDLAPGTVSVGSLDVESRLVTHTDESYGFRVASHGDQAGLVYSGDCGRAEDLGPLIRRGDTLLSEVSFGPGPVPPGAFHLDGPAVAELARASGVARVLLTHLQMGFDESATIASVSDRFGGPVELVAPGMRLTV